MIVTVASFKGGVAKSTTAVHLAAFLNATGPTVLVDGDPNRSVTGWAKRGSPPFKVVDERQATRVIRDDPPAHVVIDTPARPSREDLESLAGGCDLLVIPTTPDAFALDALMLTVDALAGVPSARYRILLAIVPPRPSRDGDDARATIAGGGLPLFAGSVRRAVAFQRAALAGCLVSEIKDPRAADAWGDYEAIGREMMP
jgi:chromosome partitioning protein